VIGTSEFEIDSVDGTLTLVTGTTLDYTVTQMYSFMVIAEDSEEEGFQLSSETEVTVHVTTCKSAVK